MNKPPQSNQSLLNRSRRKRGWTQAYVAEQVHVSIDAVRQWERGRHLPYQGTIQELCTLFQMTPEELGLLKEQDNPHLFEEEETLVYAGKTKTHDDTEQLMLQEASPVSIPPSDAVVLTINNEFFLLQGIQGIWEPNEEEKKAAWEIYVELVTRIPIATLGHGEGILREALSSMYSLFHTTREILRSRSPAIAQCHTSSNRSFSYLVVCMLNTTLRPLLSKWHPLLKDYEEIRPSSVGPAQYEQQWERNNELRQEINMVGKDLTEYANVFAQVAGVSSLIIDIS